MIYVFADLKKHCFFTLVLLGVIRFSHSRFRFSNPFSSVSLRFICFCVFIHSPFSDHANKFTSRENLNAETRFFPPRIEVRYLVSLQPEAKQTVLHQKL